MIACISIYLFEEFVCSLLLKYFNPYTKKVFTSRNVTWTGLTWGEYEKISLENYFYKTVIVLDSDEENEDEL